MATLRTCVFQYCLNCYSTVDRSLVTCPNCQLDPQKTTWRDIAKRHWPIYSDEEDARLHSFMHYCRNYRID